MSFLSGWQSLRQARRFRFRASAFFFIFSGIWGWGPGELLRAAESPAPSPLASVSPVVLPSMTPADRAALLANYKNALAAEMRALEHRQRFEMQELKAAQRAREKEFQQREKSARKEFFGKSNSGAEKRAWMQDRDRRYRTLRDLGEREFKSRQQEQTARRAALKQEQAEELKKFADELGRGQRPSEGLWPGRP